jgi:hypothetical protein
MRVVVMNVGRKDSFEVAAVHDQEPVEALTADGPDPPFDVRVRPRRPYRCADGPDPLRAEYLVESSCELVVAIVDQEPDRLRPLNERLDDVPRLLGGPLPRGVRGDSGEVHVPGGQLDEHECIEATEQHGVDALKKSQATIPLACARRNARHVSDDRRGAGSMPACWRIVHTVLAAIRIPSPESSPWMRR